MILTPQIPVSPVDQVGLSLSLYPPLSAMITPLFFLFFLLGLAAPYAFVAQIVHSVWDIGSRVAAEVAAWKIGVIKKMQLDRVSDSESGR